MTNLERFNKETGGPEELGTLTSFALGKPHGVRDCKETKPGLNACIRVPCHMQSQAMPVGVEYLVWV
jgi:hypothetical protein